MNAFAYALFPSHGPQASEVLRDEEHRRWRNDLFDKLKGPNLQAVVAFGEQAKEADGLWEGKGDLPVFEVPHPSSQQHKLLLEGWREAVPRIREVVTPDPDADPAGGNYGAGFREADYARVPMRDLPFGVPEWLGDDSWGRRAKEDRHNNSVRRPGPKDRLGPPRSDGLHTLIWIAPRG